MSIGGLTPNKFSFYFEINDLRKINLTQIEHDPSKYNLFYIYFKIVITIFNKYNNC